MPLRTSSATRTPRTPALPYPTGPGGRQARRDRRRSELCRQTAPVVHYDPGDRPLCGNDAVTAVYTDDPNQVQGREDCLELVAENLQDHNAYLGRCRHCRREITAQGGVEWRRVVRQPCPHCGRPGW